MIVVLPGLFSYLFFLLLRVNAVTGLSGGERPRQSCLD